MSTAEKFRAVRIFIYARCSKSLIFKIFFECMVMFFLICEKVDAYREYTWYRDNSKLNVEYSYIVLVRFK